MSVRSSLLTRSKGRSRLAVRYFGKSLYGNAADSLISCRQETKIFIP